MPQIHFTFYLLSTLLIIQLYFFLRYIIKLLNYNSSDEASDVHPTSVVICAHNEFDNLQNHLPNILTQQHANYEVIVVDDRSHDQSYDWLLEQKKVYPLLKVIRIDDVPNHINNKKYALTIGIKAAKNEYVLLTDADCQVKSKLWVDRMSRSFSKSTDFVLGASLYQKRKGFLNQLIQFETYKTAMLYLSKALVSKPYMGVGRNLAYRKSLFLQQKGFHGYQSLTGGDDDLFVNKHATHDNIHISVNPESVTYSIPKTNWNAYNLQKKRHYSVGKYYDRSDKLFLASIQLSTGLIYLSYILGLFFLSRNFILISSSLMLLRWVGQYVAYLKLSIKFGDKYQPWLLPIIELFELFYSFIIGLRAIRSKRIRWK